LAPKLVHTLLAEFVALPQEQKILQVVSDNFLYLLGGQCALMAFCQLLQGKSSLQKAMGAWGVKELVERADIWQSTELPEDQRTETIHRLIDALLYDNPQDTTWTFLAHDHAHQALRRLSNSQAIPRLVAVFAEAVLNKKKQRELIP